MELQPRKRLNVDSGLEDSFLFCNLPKELQREVFKFVLITSPNDLIPLLLVSKSFYSNILSYADLSPIQINFLKHITIYGTNVHNSATYHSSGYHKTLQYLSKNPSVNLAISNSSSFVIGRNWVPKTPSFAILVASVQGHVECVKILLADSRIDPTVEFDYAMEYSTNEGHKEVVAILYNDWRCRSYGKQSAFYRAAGKEDPTMLHFIMSLMSDLDINSLFIDFIYYTNISNVKILLRNERVKTEKINDGFIIACERRNEEMVRFLLTDARVDPTVHSNKAYEYAEKQNHKEITKILLEDKRVADYIAKHTQ